MQQHNLIQDATEKKVSDWVTENIRAADVFKKYDIDFCCGGGVSIESACKKAGVPVEMVMTELSKINQGVDREHDYDHFSLIELADHIECDHSFVRAIMLLVQYAEKAMVMVENYRN
jgi:regulator of cell morphogenesis and NO signaling